jgi:hypothetical protein
MVHIKAYKFDIPKIKGAIDKYSLIFFNSQLGQYILQHRLFAPFLCLGKHAVLQLGPFNQILLGKPGGMQQLMQLRIFLPTKVEHNISTEKFPYIFRRMSISHEAH